MKDAMLDRIWVTHHEQFSGDFGRVLDKAGAALGTSAGDPLPMVARAMSLVLAVSLASLSVGAALA